MMIELANIKWILVGMNFIDKVATDVAFQNGT
jgi:hypothetical protein